MGQADFGNDVMFPAIHGSFSYAGDHEAAAGSAQRGEHRSSGDGFSVNMVNVANAHEVQAPVAPTTAAAAGSTVNQADCTPQAMSADAAHVSDCVHEKKRKGKPPSTVLHEETAQSIACDILRQANPDCSPAKVGRPAHGAHAAIPRPRTLGERMHLASQPTVQAPRSVSAPRSLSRRDALQYYDTDYGRLQVATGRARRSSTLPRS